MSRIAWPALAAFVLAFVCVLPTRAAPQIQYNMALITRSMQMYVLDSSSGLVEDNRFNTTTGPFTESRTLAGLNGGRPWSISAAHDSDLATLSITGTGAVSYSMNNDDKLEIDLISQMDIPFTINEAAPYTFSSSTTGSGFVSFMNVTTSTPMPAAGVLMPGNTYQLFADASVFEFFPLAGMEFAAGWTVDLQVLPSPMSALVLLAPGLGVARRRR